MLNPPALYSEPSFISCAEPLDSQHSPISRGRSADMTDMLVSVSIWCRVWDMMSFLRNIIRSKIVDSSLTSFTVCHHVTPYFNGVPRWLVGSSLISAILLLHIVDTVASRPSANAIISTRKRRKRIENLNLCICLGGITATITEWRDWIFHPETAQIRRFGSSFCYPAIIW